MTELNVARRLSVSPDIAFAVAADVGAYSEFLPLLERSLIRGGRSVTVTGEAFRAELIVSFSKLGLREAFISSVETNIEQRTVTAQCSDGPFKLLKANWLITPLAIGSEVSISVDYQFKSMMLHMVAVGMMPTAIEKVLSAFERRALSLSSGAKPAST